jgi:hypothetical protein
MGKRSQDRSCYANECGAPAEFRCLRCGKLCCARHARQVKLERRDAPDETAPDRVQLTRVPSRARVYAFCLRCPQ